MGVLQSARVTHELLWLWVRAPRGMQFCRDVPTAPTTAPAVRCTSQAGACGARIIRYTSSQRKPPRCSRDIPHRINRSVNLKPPCETTAKVNTRPAVPCHSPPPQGETKKREKALGRVWQPERFVSNGPWVIVLSEPGLLRIFFFCLLVC